MISIAHLDQFADELPGLTTPRNVLAALHALVQPTVNVYAAWRPPVYPGNTELYTEGRNVFFHSSVTAAFRNEFWPLARKHGTSAMALLAMQRRSLLLWSEGRPMLAMRGQESWMVDLGKEHGMRDGAYSPSAAWMVAYWSPHLLRGRYKLDAKIRRSMFMAGGFAAGRLEELIEPEKVDGKVPQLTPRQYAVVRMIADGHSNVEIAKLLGVSIDSVSDVTDAAKKRLRARSRTHTAIMALRLHLIACRPLLIVGVLLCCHGHYCGG